MTTLVSIFIIIASLLLILVVLVQNPKGGGLASNFSASNQIMGVRKTADFLEKATWVLAISLVVFSLLGSMFMHKSSKVETESIIKQQLNAPVTTQPTQQMQSAPGTNSQAPQTSGGEQKAGDDKGAATAQPSAPVKK